MTRTFNIRLVFRTLGALLLIEAAFMLIPTLVSFIYHEADTLVFLISTGITAAFGLIGILCGIGAEKHVAEREGYLIVALVWVVFSIFGMLPFYLSGAIPSITDAFFETISGFTTTGATILNDIEQLTHACLIWRQLTQWLGGMGIIVLSLAILPLFGLGGMQLYAAEVTGVSYEKVSPRISNTAKILWGLYALLTLVVGVLLWLFGMNIFDAICHALSTIATGGFSTKNLSIAYFNSPAIEYTIAIFMLISGLNYSLLYYALRGKFSKLLKDEESLWYIGATLLVTIVLTAGLFLQNHNFSLQGAEYSFRTAFFTTATTITSSGFATTDYMLFKPVLWVIIFFLMFTGASSGSTSGGIKWIRIAIFAKNGAAEFKRRIHPSAIIPVKINGKPIGQQAIGNIMAFMMLYICIIVLSTLIFCALGVNFDESLGTTIATIGNVGPSLGQYGPAGTYASFPLIGKWWMTFLMLVGRLEIFTVLLLFSPALWKK